MTHVEHESTHHGHDHPGHRVRVTTHISGHGPEEFQVSGEATLFEIMAEGARLAGLSLLPPKERPFDRLHSEPGGENGPVIDHLDQTLADYLRHPGHEPRFFIELVRTFRVTKRWDVAPREEMTPKEILALPRIHLDDQEYTLYPPDSSEPLPLDKPVKIERGADFEAQRDGKYGGGE